MVQFRIIYSSSVPRPPNWDSMITRVRERRTGSIIRFFRRFLGLLDRCCIRYAFALLDDVECRHVIWLIRFGCSRCRQRVFIACNRKEDVIE